MRGFEINLLVAKFSIQLLEMISVVSEIACKTREINRIYHKFPFIRFATS